MLKFKIFYSFASFVECIPQSRSIKAAIVFFATALLVSKLSQKSLLLPARIALHQLKTSVIFCFGRGCNEGVLHKASGIPFRSHKNKVVYRLI